MREGPRGPWIRRGAATMAIAAGAVHAAQVGVHTDEDPLFGMFFAAVALFQLLGGAYVIRPIGSRTIVRAGFTFGIIGSLAVIGTWALSRSLGLPFGAEPGEVEEIGLADAAANMFELFTAFLLLLWLRQDRMTRRSWLAWLGTGASAALGFAMLWVTLRALEILDPDPRLVLEPRFADVAAVAFLSVVAVFLARLAFLSTAPDAHPRSLGSLALLVALVAVEAPLVAFTIPARGGQNMECRYAPLAEDSGISHARPPEPIEMAIGERRSVVILLLIACADAPVELAAVSPIQPRGTGVEVGSVSLDRSRASRPDRVREDPSASAVPLSGVRLLPGAGRYPVVIEARAVAEGRVELPAWRVDYVYRSEPASFGFASFTSICVGERFCARAP